MKRRNNLVLSRIPRARSSPLFLSFFSFFSRPLNQALSFDSRRQSLYDLRFWYQYGFYIGKVSLSFVFFGRSPIELPIGTELNYFRDEPITVPMLTDRSSNPLLLLVLCIFYLLSIYLLAVAVREHGEYLVPQCCGR